MNEHRKAQSLIHSGGKINPQERGWLRAHLATCPDCRAYAAVHGELSAEMPQAYAAAPLSRSQVYDRLDRIRAGAGGSARLAGLFQLSRGVMFAAGALAFVVILLAVVPGLLPDPAPLPLSDATQTPLPVTVTPSLTPEPDAALAPTGVPNGVPVLPPASASDTVNPAALLVLRGQSLVLSELNGQAFAEIPPVDGVSYREEAVMNQLQVVGALPDEPAHLPLAVILGEAHTTLFEIRQNGQRVESIKLREMAWYRAAPGRPALAYSRSLWQPLNAFLYAVPLTSFPAASPLAVYEWGSSDPDWPNVDYPEVDARYFPYEILAVDAWEDGRPRGVWVTRRMWIEGFSMPNNRGLRYYDVDNALETEVLPMDYSPQGISPDRNWIAYVGDGRVVLQSMQDGSQTSIELLSDSRWGAGYAVFSPDNAYTAWVEASGDYDSEPSMLRHTLRIAATAVKIVAQFDQDEITSAAGFPPVLVRPSGWLDNQRLLVEVTGDDERLLVFDLTSGSLSLFVDGPARFVDFVYRDGPVALAEPEPEPDETELATSAYQSINQLGGSLRGIVMQGDTAYVGMGPRVAAIDLTDPASPQLIGLSPAFPGMVNALIPLPDSPNTLIAAAGKRLVVLDVSDPANIVPLRALELPGGIISLALDAGNDILYVTGETTSQPSRTRSYVVSLRVGPDGALELLDRENLGNQITALAVGPGVLYLGADQTSVGVYAMPLAQPGELSAPRGVIGSSPEVYRAGYRLHATRDRLYVGSYDGLFVYDIRDPFNPVELEKIPAMMAEDFAFEGQQVYLYGWRPAGSFLPFQTAGMLAEAYRGPALSINSSDVALHRGLMVVAHYQLGIYDVQPESESSLLVALRSPIDSVLGAASDEENVYVVSEEMWGVAGDFTLHVLRLPDLFPLSESTIPNPGIYGGADWFRGVALEGDRLYVAGIDGVTIFDTSTTAPTQLGFLPVGDLDAYLHLQAIAAVNQDGRRLVFTAHISSGDSTTLTAYDLTNPHSPAQIGLRQVLKGETVGRMLVAPGIGRLYFSSTIGPDSYLSLARFDGSTFAVGGKIPLASHPMAFDAQGYLLIVGTQEEVIVFSTTDPQEPRQMGSLPLPGYARGILLLEDRALATVGVTYGQDVLLEIDLSDPANPVVLRQLDIPYSSGMLNHWQTTQRYLVLAGYSSGVEVLERSGE